MAFTTFNTLGFTRDDVVRLPEGCDAEAPRDADGVIYRFSTQMMVQLYH
ncbi:MAG: hypothetical protein ACLTRS_05760 [Lachnospiraceae bacterium]